MAVGGGHHPHTLASAHRFRGGPQSDSRFTYHKLAVAERFELSRELIPYRFSRPAQSTTLPHYRIYWRRALIPPQTPLSERATLSRRARHLDRFTLLNFWSGGGDSNPHIHGFEPSASCHIGLPPVLVLWVGFEPTHYKILILAPLPKLGYQSIGARDGIRTHTSYGLSVVPPAKLGYPRINKKPPTFLLGARSS